MEYNSVSKKIAVLKQGYPPYHNRVQSPVLPGTRVINKYVCYNAQATGNT